MRATAVSKAVPGGSTSTSQNPFEFGAVRGDAWKVGILTSSMNFGAE